MASSLSEVKQSWRNVRPTQMCRLLCDGVLVVSMGSVVDFSGDAIVNAANRTCLGGGGVDGAISKAGGPELLKARQALPVIKREGKEDIRCPTGEARITIGGRLRAKWCIHAVGPNYRVEMAGSKSAAECDRLLKSAYTAAMHLAAKQGVKTIAFSLISAGVFRGPRSLEEVLEIAAQGIVAGDYDGLKEVRACVHACVRACVRACVGACMRACVRRFFARRQAAGLAAEGVTCRGACSFFHLLVTSLCVCVCVPSSTSW